MTNKQIKTLLLFSQNYSLSEMAKDQKVSISTIRNRLNIIWKRYNNYYNNALFIRNKLKEIKYNLQHPVNFTSYNNTLTLNTLSNIYNDE
jgi:predicted DNA-binding protein YlxM (UPF0122 family)